VEDPPVRKTVRRGPNDDPVIAAAVAGNARYIVAYDRHLLDLEKPYGVACVTPRAFLAGVLRES
jgi:predicted nucleic acid-binding protein